MDISTGQLTNAMDDHRPSLSWPLAVLVSLVCSVITTAPVAAFAADRLSEQGPSSPGVLLLNVVNSDGSVTEVVYPGQLVALELQSDHHGVFGVPVVTECNVTNPLQPRQHGLKSPAFFRSVLTRGCGQGGLLPTDRGFAKSAKGYITPSFPLPASWTSEAALLFACDVIICDDVRACRQACPPPSLSLRVRNQTPHDITAIGPHDVTVRMESQVVTSCPRQSDGSVAENDDPEERMTYSPQCAPYTALNGSHPHLQGTDAAQKNLTPAGASSKIGDVINNGFPPVTSVWSSRYLLLVIIVIVFGMLILLVLSVAFCKMVALQRQVARCNQLLAISAVGVDHNNISQMTGGTTTSHHHLLGTRTPGPTNPTANDNGHTADTPPHRALRIKQGMLFKLGNANNSDNDNDNRHNTSASARYSTSSQSATVVGLDSKSVECFPLPSKALPCSEQFSPGLANTSADAHGNGKLSVRLDPDPDPYDVPGQTGLALYDVPPSFPTTVPEEGVQLPLKQDQFTPKVR